MQNEWQAFLNLCLAQETHLDNIEDYKKVQHPSVTDCEFILPLNAVYSESKFIYLSDAVPAGGRDGFRLPEETQRHSGPKVAR